MMRMTTRTRMTTPMSEKPLTSGGSRKPLSSKQSEWLRLRYDSAQANPHMDTAAKRLARVKLCPELAALEMEKCG